MNGQVNDGVASAFFMQFLRSGADSGQIAESIAVSCRAIETSLSPIIGWRGVAALYKRGVHLTARPHTWLVGAQDGVPDSMDIAILTSLLAEQTGAEAAAAGAFLLQTFHDLLGTLVGPSLTEQLLRSVWATFLICPTAEDIPSRPMPLQSRSPRGR